MDGSWPTTNGADQLIAAAASRVLAPRSSIGQWKAVRDMEQNSFSDERRVVRACLCRAASAGEGEQENENKDNDFRLSKVQPGRQDLLINPAIVMTLRSDS
jgi:hypothetical protein